MSYLCVIWIYNSSCFFIRLSPIRRLWWRRLLLCRFFITSLLRLLLVLLHALILPKCRTSSFVDIIRLVVFDSHKTSRTVRVASHVLRRRRRVAWIVGRGWNWLKDIVLLWVWSSWRTWSHHKSPWRWIRNDHLWLSYLSCLSSLIIWIRGPIIFMVWLQWHQVMRYLMLYSTTSGWRLLGFWTWTWESI